MGAANVFSQSIPMEEISQDYYSCGMKRFFDEKTSKIGFENKKGTVVLPAIYCIAERFVKNKCLVYTNAELKEKSTTDGEIIRCWENGKWGVIDKKGRFIVPCKYKRVWSENLGIILYQTSCDSFFVNPKGRIKFIKK